MNFSICYMSLFLLGSLSMVFFFMGVNFLMYNYALILEYMLLNLNSVNLNFIILFDYMSLLFSSLVLLISSMVIWYSKSYMGSDYNMNRFIYLVLLFILSMMLLIFMPNMFSILLGWDGLGLVSFCLVIYYQNNKSYNSGLLVVLSNRIGDVFILMAICWMFNFGSWSFMNYLYYFKMNEVYQLVGMYVMLAAITKSAQIPFSSWLPAAMAAPTPVSSLVHSSTLVTAGVYLLIRFNDLMNHTLIFKILLVLGGMTMFMSGLAANFEYDLKKIIALSTLSQLGLMMSILSLGGMIMSFFHLLVHAMFKALLFMCSGMMIHNLLGVQDIRNMSNLVKFMPLTGSYFLVSNLALSGFPFLAGFYSKDLILDSVSMMNVNFIMWLMFMISTMLTISYTVRMLYFVLFKLDFMFLYLVFEDFDLTMFYSMMVLGILSMIGGALLVWLIFSQIYFIYLVKWLKFMVMLVLIMGIFSGFFFSYFSLVSVNNFFFNYFKFLNFNMWFLVLLSTWGLNKYFLYLMKIYNEIIEIGWNEYFVNFNMVNYLIDWSKNKSNYMMFSYKIYLFLMVIWILVFYFVVFICV
uniref:NADH dehydrogenase subunit 5 n=1 Tax=Hydroptila angulata TaxID=1875522 RepID=UPI0022DCE206|nr:NADH dehydrogenase subunit 5 [Hydroptila angulata]UZZ44046.1 NADH dehydrogenase subunit 5 [Hydroptila angulata]